MTSVRRELRQLAHLALPVVGTQLATMLLGVVDTAMLGRVSVEAMAASALSFVWMTGSLTIAGTGVLLGMDPLVTQAHGAGRHEETGLVLQRALVLSLALSVICGALWFFTEEALIVFGQDAGLARDAEIYAIVQIPSIPFFLGYTALRQYLQGRGFMRPAFWVIAFANVLNALFNWVLIFGKFGVPAFGLVGAAGATALTRTLSFIMLALIVWRMKLHAGAWPRFGRAAFDRRGITEIGKQGVAVAVQISTEFWAFSGAALLAGHLGKEAVAAHNAAIQMAATAFMIPLGISQAAVTRVGQLVGARRFREAQHAAWVAMALGGGATSIAALCFVIFRWQLPLLFTDVPAVVALVASVLPIAAAFQLFDGVQAVGCGVLRGMGQPRPAAAFNLIGYWVLGLPIGAWLTFGLKFGLPGIWWGLCLGLAVIAALLTARIKTRGPLALGS